MPTNSTPPAQPRTKEPGLTDPNQIDFRKLYYTLRERLWVILLCLLVAALGTATYLVRAPKIFASKLVLQVEQEEQKILNIQRVQQEDPQSLEFLKTVEQTLQSRSLFERVLDTNNLAADPRFLKIEPGASRPMREQLVTRLSKMVEAKLRKGTRLIDVKVEHTSPEIAALIARSLLVEFLGQASPQRLTEVERLRLRKQVELAAELSRPLGVSVVEERVAHVWTVRDDTAIRYRVFTSRDEALLAIGLGGLRGRGEPAYRAA